MGLIIDGDDVDDDVGAQLLEEIVVVDAFDVTAILLSIWEFVMLVVEGVPFVAKNDQYICDEDDVDDKYDDDDDDDSDDEDDECTVSMMLMMMMTIQMLMTKINMMMNIMINMTVLKTITMI